jgi:hypothetical protein
MTPSIDERLASIVRALSGVVLPSLPPEAALAREQVQLSIGHLQILRAQLDHLPAYEAEELADAVALAQALGACQGGPQTGAATAALRAALGTARAAADPAAVREARVDVNGAIARLVAAAAEDGDATGRAGLRRAILAHEQARTAKDRRWFAPFGFDSLPAEDASARAGADNGHV